MSQEGLVFKMSCPDAVGLVARVTGLSTDAVRQLVAENSQGRILGFLGEPTVNVTTLNLAVAAARG